MLLCRTPQQFEWISKTLLFHMFVGTINVVHLQKTCSCFHIFHSLKYYKDKKNKKKKTEKLRSTKKKLHFCYARPEVPSINMSFSLQKASPYQLFLMFFNQLNIRLRLEAHFKWAVAIETMTKHISQNLKFLGGTTVRAAVIKCEIIVIIVKN